MKKLFSIDMISKYRTEIMGVCIIWIMLFHSGIEAPTPFFLRGIWYLVVSFGGGFGVNIFFILSGMGLMYSALEKKRLGKKEKILYWYKKRLKRILPAYFVVAIIFYLITTNRTLEELLYNLFFLNFIIEGKRDFWYIFAIILYYIIFPFYLKAVQNINFKFILMIVLILAIALSMSIFYLNPLWYKKFEILLWRFPCFVIGCHLGILISKKREKDFLFNLILFSFGGILILSVFGFLRAQSYIQRNVFTCLSPLVIVLVSVLLNFILNKIKLAKIILKYLGERSLELYLSHVSFGLLLMKYVEGKYIKLLVYFVSSFIIANIVYYIKKIERK